MQAVILAAGNSSRFHPFNDLHKSMVKILGRPILEYTITGLKKTGIEKIILVTNENKAIEEYFGDGKKIGVSIEYVIQKESLGMGNALLLAEKKVKGKFLLINAYRVDTDKFINLLLKKKRTNNAKAVILAKKRDDVSIQGVLKIEKNRILEVIEKPKKGKEPSNLCVVGIYCFSLDFLETLKNTSCEHYQLEKAISDYAKKNYVSYVEAKEDVITLKYPWDLLGIKNYLLKNIKTFVGKNVSIAKNAQIIGSVVIEDGVQIMESAVIKGPCFIGKNAFIGNNAVLRNGVDIEENAVVGAYMEVKNSILMESCKTHSGFIGDSVIGKDCRIGAGFCTANVRLDRTTIKTNVKNEKIDTGLKSLGTMVGNGTYIGIKSSTMPGVIIGQKATIGVNTTVLNNVFDNTKYYTKFQEVIIKKSAKGRSSSGRKKFVLFDIDYTLFDTNAFKNSQLKDYKVYDEVLLVLDKLSKIADLGIFSKGEVEFQNTKLKKTYIKKFFQNHHIHIFEDKDVNIKNVLDKYRNHTLFLVDDKLLTLYAAKLYNFSVFTIWVRRGPFAKDQRPIKNFSPNATIYNLSDLNKIIESN